MSEPPRADVAAERRWGRVAGPLALLAFMLTMAAVPVGSRNLPVREGDGDDRTLLQDISIAEDDQLLAMLLRCASLVMLVVVVVVLFRITRARNPAHPWLTPVTGALGALVTAGGTAAGFFLVKDVADEFVRSGPETLQRAERLLDDKRGEGPLRVANISQIIGGLLVGIWVSLASYEGMRVGLLTRFLGIFGVGAGLATAIGLPIGTVLFLGWLASVGILMLGAWPGGRPPAWEAGTAVSWDEVDDQQRSSRREATR